jgi:hypothetical protein
MTWRLAALVGVVALLVAAGCRSHHTPKSVVPSFDCFDAWNASGNERNRADLAERGFAIGSVERGTTFADPGVGGTARTSESCGYLFHSDTRFVSYTGDWSGASLLWTNSQGMHGRWSAAQQRTQPDDVRVVADGRIAKR